MCTNCQSGDRPIAAIWARVSTEDQLDLSPETQIGEVRPWLEEQGYVIPDDFVIKVHWTSQEVLECPMMNDMLSWARNGDIHAVGVLHDDRLAGTPGSKAIILEVFAKAGVRYLPKHNPLPEGTMGEMVALLNGMNKRNQVEELRKAVKGGIRDRAKILGLPTNGKAPYGFQFRYEVEAGKKKPVALEPDEQTYAVACRILRLALDGTKIRRICAILVNDGIPAPRGGKEWGTNTVSKILKNPIYGGRYYALRQEARAPKSRSKPGVTYGNSSSGYLGREDWHLLDFPIEGAVVTWDEWEAVQARLRKNWDESHGRPKRFYMLRGMMFDPEDGRRYVGSGGQREDYYYVCSRRYRKDLGIEPCNSYHVYGPTAENAVWNAVEEFVKDPRAFMAEVERRRGDKPTVERELQETIQGLEDKIRKVTAMETDLLGMSLRVQVPPEAYERQSAFMRAEKTHYRDEIGRQEVQLASYRRAAEAIDSLEAMRERFMKRLESATPQDKRWVLEALDLRVDVLGKREFKISIGVPPQELVNEGARSIHHGQAWWTHQEMRITFSAGAP